MVICSLCGCGQSVEKYNSPAGEGVEVDAKNLQSVIENAILVDKYFEFSDCEAYASVYKELTSETKGNKTKYYLVASTGGYILIDDKLSRQSGGKPFPVVVTVKKSGEEYKITEIKSGAFLATLETRQAFIKENMPSGINSESFVSDNMDELFAKERKQILLKYSDKKYVFEGKEQPREMLPLWDYAYNQMLEFFEEYPEWIGKIERIENGKKYTYNTEYVSETEDRGVVSFVKRDEAGNEVARTDILVDGDNVEIIGGNPEENIENDIGSQPDIPPEMQNPDEEEIYPDDGLIYEEFEEDDYFEIY